MRRSVQADSAGRSRWRNSKPCSAQRAPPISGSTHVPFPCDVIRALAGGFVPVRDGAVVVVAQHSRFAVRAWVLVHTVTVAPRVTSFPGWFSPGTPRHVRLAMLADGYAAGQRRRGATNDRTFRAIRRKLETVKGAAIRTRHYVDHLTFWHGDGVIGIRVDGSAIREGAAGRAYGERLRPAAPRVKHGVRGHCSTLDTWAFSWWHRR